MQSVSAQRETLNSNGDSVNVNASFQRYRSVIETAHDCILVINKSSQIQLFNRAAQSLFGYHCDEVLGKSIELLIPSNMRCGHSAYVSHFGQSKQQSREMSSRSIVYGQHKNGSIFPAEISISKIDVDGEMEFTAVVRDISERSQLLEQLHHQANTDSLTGVFNRLYLNTQLAKYIDYAQKEQWPLTLLMIDLDNFKQINDIAGHAGGDDVLRAFVLEAGRAINVAHTLGRYGGEEFIVLLQKQDLDTALEQAERVRIACQNNRVKDIQYTVSIGVVELSLGEVLHQFVDRADKALYLAKRLGRNRVQAG